VLIRENNHMLNTNYFKFPKNPQEAIQLNSPIVEKKLMTIVQLNCRLVEKEKEPQQRPYVKLKLPVS
jgi:hypothetical protein